MAKRRPSIPTVTQTKLLTQSKRRCCLCFGLKADIEVKEGQIAHLDRNASNNHLENLAWLCLPHHDDYDSIRRQTKRLTPDEVKLYRLQLYEQLSKAPFTSSILDVANEYEEESDPALNVIYRYSSADHLTSKVIAAEITTRIEQMYEFSRLNETELRALDDLNLPEDGFDARCWEIHHRVREHMGLPLGIYGLGGEEPLTSKWRRSARRLAKKWIAGELSYEQCKDVLWIFDEQCDLDPHFILFGLPNESLSRMQMRALTAFVFEHGQRRFIDPHLLEDIPF